MRLINTRTLEITVFTEAEVSERPYAILSHTWGPDEVTLDDMKDLTAAKSMKGFAKIKKTCRKAEKYEYRFAWVDTCCIDKRSSAELLEAINSMFKWYQNAAVCFVYLEDLSPNGQNDTVDSMKHCRWFTRGWTLQELIAPRRVHFYDIDWALRGTKQNLAKGVSAITGIDRRILDSTMALSDVSLAQRMSWASRRQTSREEDRAYSLLGIFDVNMAMLYSEGRKAFTRLQEEILESATDLSLLAWQTFCSTDPYCGVLAHSPDDFYACGDVVLGESQFRFNDEIVNTNKGLKIRAALQPNFDGTYGLDLHCYHATAEQYHSICIRLGRALDVYFRAKPSLTEQNSRDIIARRDGLPQLLYLAYTAQLSLLRDMIVIEPKSKIFRGVSLQLPYTDLISTAQVGDLRAVPSKYWIRDRNCFIAAKLPTNFRCFVRFRVTLGRTEPNANRPLPRKGVDYEITRFLLCITVGASDLRFSLYDEASVQTLVNIAGGAFIDPFDDIESYGSSGHPRSMDWLKPGGLEERGFPSSNNRFVRLSYMVSAVEETDHCQLRGAGPNVWPSFYIRIVIQRIESSSSAMVF